VADPCKAKKRLSNECAVSVLSIRSDAADAAGHKTTQRRRRPPVRRRTALFRWRLYLLIRLLGRTGRSGLVHAHSTPDYTARIEAVLLTVVFSRKPPRYAAFCTGCILTAVPRSIGSAVCPPWDGKMSLQIAIRESLTYIAAYRRTQSSSCQISIRVDGHTSIVIIMMIIMQFL